jgi:penicillin-binding protein 2
VENGGFGASAAAPIARKVMDAYLLPQLKGTAADGKSTPATTTVVEIDGEPGVGTIEPED